MENIERVPLEKAFRLINHGPTTLISTHFNGIDNVMAAAWVCALDYDPPKLMVVIDKASKTREMIEKSGEFIVQLPTVAQIKMTYAVGTISLTNDSEKNQKAGVEFFRMEGDTLPYVSGCAGWLRCRVIPERHNQETYDLFIASVTDAWADTRVFREGRWDFENADPDFRTIHHVSGGKFYAIGEGMEVKALK